MRSILNVVSRLVLVGLLLGVGAGSIQAANPDWPASEPGRHARDYFAAFNAGEPAMRAFWTSHGSPKALSTRPVEQRVDVWRQMHKEFGAFTPLRVLDSGPDFVEVLARCERGLQFRVRFLCEPDAPHGLTGLHVENADEEDAKDESATDAAESGPPPKDEEIVAGLSAQLDALSQAGAFSGAVLLDKGGEPLFQRACGLASRSDSIPNRIDTRFNLASINKIFTHVAILQLAQAGKLSLDDTIDRFLDDYPKENARRITIAMLLDHRSGVPDVLRNDKLRENAPAVSTWQDWYALVRDMPLDFEPGAKQQYSNGGFVLLGAVIAHVSGEDYYDYIDRHIYGPAGMTRSGHDRLNDPERDRAEGYSGRVGSIERLGRGSPAGGGYSTVGDLVRFAQALRGGKLLDGSHTRDLLGDRTALAIAGGSPGVNAFFQMAGPYTFAVLANLDPPAAERFGRTTVRMIRRAAGLPSSGSGETVRAGGGS